MKKLYILVQLITFLIASVPSAFSLIDASFSADDTVGCSPLTVHFTNNGTPPGAKIVYGWLYMNSSFAPIGSSSLENPTFLFSAIGTNYVRHIVTDTSTWEADTILKSIIVYKTPSSNLFIDSTNKACVNGDIVFISNSSADSVLWDFDDGTFDRNIASYVTHSFLSNGTYTVKYYTYRGICSDTSANDITIGGPTADLIMGAEEACKGDNIEFSINIVSSVDSFSWNLSEGDIKNNLSPVNHTYNTSGDYAIKLTLYGSAKTCLIDDTLSIRSIFANFTYSGACDKQYVYFNNTSSNKDFNYWDFGNGEESFIKDPAENFDAGNYTVKLVITDYLGCKDSIQKNLIVNEPPTLTFDENTVACEGQPVTLNAYGGHLIVWTPGTLFDDSTSYTPNVTPVGTTIYFATITDTLTKCSQSDSVTVYTQDVPETGMISVMPDSMTIFIGDTVFVYVYDSLLRQLTYSWTPDDDEISCIDCPNPYTIPTDSKIYTLSVSDTNQCFTPETFEVVINVKKVYPIGVPDAFTPNGDGINDIIKVDGKGIKEFYEFRIYNRWGTEMFYTTDINNGWDGYYKGKLQNIDSYAYVIKALMYDETVVVKKGTFSLLK